MPETVPVTAPVSRPPCLVCDGPLAPAPRLPGLDECARCGFVTADVAVSDEELLKLYGEDYFHGDEYADYVSEAPELRANFRRRLETLARLQPESERGRLYEVGAAYGFFLDEAKGAYGTVSGIDISSDAATFAREQVGVDVTAGDYLGTDLDGQVDLLCMWDTVEHLATPGDFIIKAGQDVRPGGLIALTTGDIDSLNARMRGKRWRMIHPPTHLHYFSRRTMTLLLDRAGFDVVHHETAGNARTLRGIAYAVLVLRARKQRLFDVVTRVPGLSWVLDRSVTLDLRDIMFVVARRRA